MPSKKTVTPKLPSNTAMREALVALVEYERDGKPLEPLQEKRGNETSTGIRRDATTAARLSAKRCHFCEAPRSALVEPINWAAYELCDCLSDLRSDEAWHMRVPGAIGLLSLLTAVDSRAIEDSVPVVTRGCCGVSRGPHGEKVSCTTRFTLHTGSVAAAVRTYLRMQRGIDADRGIVRTDTEILESFTWPRRCKECRDAVKARAAVRGDRAAPPTPRQRASASPADVLAETMRRIGDALAKVGG